MLSNHAMLCIVTLIGCSLAAKSCIRCICEHESICKPIGCRMDVGSLSCGYFQIKLPYYKDCGTPGKRSGESVTTAWKRCANKYSCAKKCVENYHRRYRRNCPSRSKCQQMARLHNGGPNGCRVATTDRYWNAIHRCCGCAF